MTESRSHRRGPWQSLRAWIREHEVQLVLGILAFLAVFIYLAPSIFVFIYPGEAGVLWSRFFGGTRTMHRQGEFQSRIHADAEGEPEALRERGYVWDGPRYPLHEGTRLKFPWDKIYIYDIRLQKVEHVYDVLASNGLDLKVDILIRWKLIEADLGKLHRDIGPNYVEKLIIPVVGSHAREIIGRRLPEELYASSRLEIQKQILARVKEEMKVDFYPEEKRESFVIVEDVLIRSIELPERVRQAIQEKVQQKHLADAYIYRLDRERQEASRKEIEARGIQRFQETIEGSISERYLKWKGIEATLELARSPNAKIVVIGAGDDGLPIILGGLDQLPGPLALPPGNQSPGGPPPQNP